MVKYIPIVFIIFLAGCASNGTPQDPNSENYLGYQAIDPLPVDKVMLYEKPNEQPPRLSSGQMKEVYWAEFINEPCMVRELLPLQTAQVSVLKNDVSGKVSYLTASVSGDSGSYTVIMDYMKYRVEDVVNEANNNEYLGTARIGVGLRIKAVLVTNNTNLNFASLMAIGVEAKQGNLKGSISVDVIGMDSEAITDLIPLTSEIDQTSIQAALQALASIKTKMYEDKTKLTPHLVAIRQAKARVGQQIKDKATTSVRKGILKAQLSKEKEKEILSAIVSGGVLDKAKWDALVDGTNLSSEQKTKFKALDNIDKIKNNLDVDAGMNGTTISALHKAL
jgi:hypothetical protein